MLLALLAAPALQAHPIVPFVETVIGLPEVLDIRIGGEWEGAHNEPWRIAPGLCLSFGRIF